MAWDPTYDASIPVNTVLLGNGITFSLQEYKNAKGKNLIRGRARNPDRSLITSGTAYQSGLSNTPSPRRIFAALYQQIYGSKGYVQNPSIKRVIKARQTSTLPQKANLAYLKPKEAPTPSPRIDATPPFRITDRGEGVANFQKLLNGVFPDGIFGEQTEFEVKRFQEFEGIQVDGIVGNETLRLLKERAQNLVFIPKPISPIVNRENKQQQTVDKLQTNTLITEGSLSPQVVVQNTPTDLKPKGLQRINNLITTIAIDSQKAIVLQLQQLLLQYGVQKLQESLDNGENIENLKQEYCPTPERLEELIGIRNNIAGLLNTVGDKLNTLTVGVNFSGQFAELLQALVSGLKGAEFVLNQAAKLIPLIPGAIVSAVNDLGTISDTFLVKKDGTPIIPTIRQVVTSVQPPFALIQQVIQLSVSLLDQLDAIVLLCAPNATLTSTSSTIDNIYATQTIAENTETGNTYKGFTLEIETRAFTPKVDQSRAVGKNNQGIVLIATDYSFASNPNVLIDELKFIIDRDNLKAY